jgi:hydroxymethylpyrimidine/phosphomethylpyrimidine kinase
VYKLLLQPGETIISSEFRTLPGGKGANQTEAEAAATKLRELGVDIVILTGGIMARCWRTKKGKYSDDAHPN